MHRRSHLKSARLRDNNVKFFFKNTVDESKWDQLYKNFKEFFTCLNIAIFVKKVSLQLKSEQSVYRFKNGSEN